MRNRSYWVVKTIVEQPVTGNKENILTSRCSVTDNLFDVHYTNFIYCLFNYY